MSGCQWGADENSHIGCGADRALSGTSWSYDVCVGSLSVDVSLPNREHASTMRVVRNTGGGTSLCCAQFPVAAPVKVSGASVQLRLLPRPQPEPTSEAHDKTLQRGRRLARTSAADTAAANQAGRNGARIYFADDPARQRGAAGRCEVSSHSEVAYAGWRLLGREISFTVDLSAAECGCNAAVYLVSMRQNRKPYALEIARVLEPGIVYVHFRVRAKRALGSRCARRGVCGGDFYCDDFAVCGVRCDEIDLLEANRHAIQVTAHGADVAAGLGGKFNPDGHWVGVSPTDYGPGSTYKIDTTRPFRVSVYFKTDGALRPRLSSIEVRLMGEQGGVVSFSLNSPALDLLTDALAAGMTPAASYW